MTIDLFLLRTMFIRLIVDWSTFSSYAISVSVVECAHNVATFLRPIVNFEVMRYQD